MGPRSLPIAFAGYFLGPGLPDPVIIEWVEVPAVRVGTDVLFRCGVPFESHAGYPGPDFESLLSTIRQAQDLVELRPPPLVAEPSVHQKIPPVGAS